MDQVAAYREGIVRKEAVCHLNCCVPRAMEEEVFHYIEIIFKDGSRKFAYEDEKGFEEFKKNFEKNRFTSFHEFFTTEKTAYEDRGEISLRYFEYRENSDYIVGPLEKIREELKEERKLEDRITEPDKYDRRVNYHCE